jgi:hypothetical protein
MNELDVVLDKLEELTEGHPLPMTRAHCQYCSAWLVILEDVLNVTEEE